MHVMVCVYTRTFETVAMKPVRVAMPLLITKMTCVLSQMWRYIWKFMPNVVITNESIEDSHISCYPESLRCFYQHLPSRVLNYFNHENYKANAWIFHALLVCNFKELKISIRFDDELLNMANRIIISEHLRKLELDSLNLKDNFVDSLPVYSWRNYK
uniref:Uncharacterized protein n=1 Tax=Oryza barthii TaxID=65489 RepID=A0A0D3GEE4_9ORYZ